MFTTNLYYNMVIITNIYRNEQIISDCLKFLILFSLYHFLLVADNTKITNLRVCYSFNILKPDFSISYKLVVCNAVARTSVYKTNIVPSSLT